MNRREFLKVLSAAGMVSSTPALFMEQAMASSSDAYNGPLLLVLKASGGFQQSAFCDPRDRAWKRWGKTTTGSVSGTAGNLKYAPVQENKMLFEKYHDRMLVINGVQWNSNGHGGASLDQQSGRPTASMPAFSALLGRVSGSDLPLPWVLAGETKRVSGGGVLSKAVIPPLGAEKGLANTNQGFIESEDMAILRRYQDARSQQVINSTRLPYLRSMAANLNDARNNTGLLQNLANTLDGVVLDTHDHNGKALPTASKLHHMMLAMKAGVTVAGQTWFTAIPPEVEGMKPERTFDTHGLTENTNHLTFLHMTRTIDYVWEKAEQLGIADRLIVHLASDVGRTMGGTGHYTIGSTVLMAKNKPWTGRVVGTSGPTLEKTPIDPVTLQPLAASDGGVVLRSAHVQRTMRQIFGIDQHPLCQKFEFDDPQIDLLNPQYSSPLNV